MRAQIIAMINEHPPIIDYESSDYQTTFWDQGDRAYEDQAEAVALRRLLPPSGELLLEIGAGAGRNTPRYAGFDRLVLLDYSRSQLEQARRRLGDSHRYIFVAADVYRLPFVAGVFDAATMIRVLHHIVDPQRALSQIRETLAPGGIFILEYANKHNLKAILRYALRQQTWNPFDLEPVEFAPLNFDFHPDSIRQWLVGQRFSVERQLTVSHFRLGVLKRRLPLKFLVALDALAQLTGNWWQLSPSVFVRARAVGDTHIAAQGDLFKCPACENAQLTGTGTGMLCSKCGQLWPIEGGIYDFRVKPDSFSTTQK